MKGYAIFVLALTVCIKVVCASSGYHPSVILVWIYWISMTAGAVPAIVFDLIYGAERRAEARERRIERAIRKARHVRVKVDARTVAIDNRSVTIVGQRPKEESHGSQERIAGR